MHDVIGSAGMLRGWVTMWTTQMLWLLAALTVSVAMAAIAELVIVRRARRRDALVMMIGDSPQPE